MHLFPFLSSCNPFFSKMQRVGPLRMSLFCRRCWGCDYIHLVWRWTWVWTELLLYVSCWIQEREAAWLGVVWYQTLSWRLRWNLNRSTFVWNSLAMFMGAKVRPLERTETWLVERGIPEMFITCSSWSCLCSWCVAHDLGLLMDLPLPLPLLVLRFVVFVICCFLWIWCLKNWMKRTRLSLNGLHHCLAVGRKQFFSVVVGFCSFVFVSTDSFFSL